MLGASWICLAWHMSDDFSGLSTDGFGLSTDGLIARHLVRSLTRCCICLHCTAFGGLHNEACSPPITAQYLPAFGVLLSSMDAVMVLGSTAVAPAHAADWLKQLVGWHVPAPSTDHAFRKNKMPGIVCIIAHQGPTWHLVWLWL